MSVICLPVVTNEDVTSNQTEELRQKNQTEQAAPTMRATTVPVTPLPTPETPTPSLIVQPVPVLVESPTPVLIDVGWLPEMPTPTP